MGRNREGLRVMVTGSSGELGALLCQELNSLGYNVIGVDLKCGSQVYSTRLIKRDLSLGGSLDEIMESVYAIVHTAALHGAHFGQSSQEFIFTNNVMALANVLRSAAMHRVQRVVFTSSTSVYGVSSLALQEAVWLDEGSPLNPRDAYDQSKVIGEQLCHYHAEVCGTTCVSLRCSRFDQSDLVTHNVYKLFRGVDVRDVVTAHIQALEKPLCSGSHKIYNVSAPSPFMKTDSRRLLSDPISVIEDYYPGAEQFFLRKGWKLPTAIDRVYDISVAQMELGYLPQHTFSRFLEEELRVERANIDAVEVKYE